MDRRALLNDDPTDAGGDVLGTDPSPAREGARTVVVVEDDDHIADRVGLYLGDAGFTVRRAATGAHGIASVDEFAPSAVVLDLGLPDMDGTDVLRAVRTRSSAPVLVVTARGDEFDRVLGLELGADDYIVKPFSPRELVARVRAVLRRAEAIPAGTARTAPAATARGRRATGRAAPRCSTTDSCSTVGAGR
ncbi:MAG: response regulator [Microthrixaceae bacterium]